MAQVVQGTSILHWSLLALLWPHSDRDDPADLGTQSLPSVRKDRLGLEARGVLEGLDLPVFLPDRPGTWVAHLVP